MSINIKDNLDFANSTLHHLMGPAYDDYEFLRDRGQLYTAIVWLPMAVNIDICLLEVSQVNDGNELKEMIRTKVVAGINQIKQKCEEEINRLEKIGE